MAGIPHRKLTIDDYTPSDATPWNTVWDEEEEVPHVVPGFGPPHDLSRFCWCHPVFDNEYVVGAWSHFVAQ